MPYDTAAMPSRVGGIIPKSTPMRLDYLYLLRHPVRLTYRKEILRDFHRYVSPWTDRHAYNCKIVNIYTPQHGYGEWKVLYWLSLASVAAQGHHLNGALIRGAQPMILIRCHQMSAHADNSRQKLTNCSTIANNLRNVKVVKKCQQNVNNSQKGFFLMKEVHLHPHHPSPHRLCQ
jgi:hypothetical protein